MAIFDFNNSKGEVPSLLNMKWIRDTASAILGADTAERNHLRPRKGAYQFGIQLCVCCLPSRFSHPHRFRLLGGQVQSLEVCESLVLTLEASLSRVRRLLLLVLHQSKGALALQEDEAGGHSLREQGTFTVRYNRAGNVVQDSGSLRSVLGLPMFRAIRRVCMYSRVECLWVVPGSRF